MTLKNTYTISAVIRTYNEAKYIGQVIETIHSQKTIGDVVEIVVVDSDSTDSTVEIVKKYGIELIEIPKAEFNYSRALNLGIEKSTGDLIVILSAHSIPREDGWLQRIIAHFKDEKVAGVYCRQIAWPDANLHEILRIQTMFDETSRSFSKEASNANMSFSNVASCIRRSVWEKHPFVILPAAEDREWAQWSIENGYTIVYDPKVSVYHSHNESCRKAAQRQIELEKSADIRLSRNRTPLFTMRQAIRMISREIRKVFAYSHHKESKLKLCLQAFCRGFWYFVDFSRRKVD